MGGMDETVPAIREVALHISTFDTLDRNEHDERNEAASCGVL